jgi:hypothetical protein
LQAHLAHAHNHTHFDPPAHPKPTRRRKQTNRQTLHRARKAARAVDGRHAHVQRHTRRRTAICTHRCVWGKRYHCPLEVTIRCESASAGGRIPHQTHFPAPECFLYLKPTKEGRSTPVPIGVNSTHCESTRVAYSAVGTARAARVCRARPCRTHGHHATAATIPLRAGRCGAGP